MEKLTGSVELCEAAATANRSEVHRLLKEGVSANGFIAQLPSLSVYDWTALHAVANSGDEEIAKELIDSGADVNAARAEMISPLIVAAQGGNLRVAQILIDNGAQVNHLDRYRRSALHYAARRGYIDLVEVLIASGAEIDIVDEKGRTPLIDARQRGHADQKMVLLLSPNSDPASTIVRNDGHVDMVNEADVTLLCEAAASGDVSEIEYLLQQGVPVNRFVDYLESLGVYDWTPLHAASASGHIESMKMLIEHGANVNASRTEMMSPLIVAAHDGQKEAVLLLLRSKANVNHIDRYRRNALHRAAANGHIDVVRSLVEAGINIELSDENGRTPRDMAIDKGHATIPMMRLVTPKANPLTSTEDIRLCEAAASGNEERVQELLTLGCLPNEFVAYLPEYNAYDWTPLHAACCNGHSAIVDILVKAGADLEAGRALTPLFEASCEGHTTIVKQLLDYGADINHLDRYGQNALHRAAARGQIKTVKALIKAGADPYLVEKCNHQTPLEMAKDKGNDSKEMRKLLSRPKKAFGLKLWH